MQFAVQVSCNWVFTSNAIRCSNQCNYAIKERRINMIVETREDVAEADLVNAVLWKHLGELTTKDVLKYREEILKKD